MKRTILAVLMAVMVFTPCLAQEVETDGLFSIDGTLWTRCGISISDIEPSFSPPSCWGLVGFDQGNVYSCMDEGNSCTSNESSYIDLLVVSIVTWRSYGPSTSKGLYILQPSGFGVFTSFFRSFSPHPRENVYSTGIMFKVQDDWTPPEVE